MPCRAKPWQVATQHHIEPAPPPGRRDFLQRFGLGPKGGFQISAARSAMDEGLAA